MMSPLPIEPGPFIYYIGEGTHFKSIFSTFFFPRCSHDVVAISRFFLSFFSFSPQILILIGMCLFSLAYAFLTKYQRSERDEEEFLPYSWEDEIVYKTSFAICTFSLAVSQLNS